MTDIKENALGEKGLPPLEEISSKPPLKTAEKKSGLPPIENIVLDDMADNKGSESFLKANKLPPIGTPSQKTDTVSTSSPADSIHNDSQHTLDDIPLDNITLDNITMTDMSNSNTSGAKSIAHQMKLDDISLDMQESPVLEDLSTQVKATYDKSKADAMYRPVVEKSEKELIKERLAREMSNVPDNIDRKESLALYNKLLEEQHEKEAKKGFGSTVFVVFLGLACAAITYFLLDWQSNPVFKYMSYATILFSIVLLIKAKFFKIISTLFFGANTLVLIIPGIINFAINTELKDTSFFLQMAYLVAATILSVIACIQLSTSSKIEAYFSKKSK